MLSQATIDTLKTALDKKAAETTPVKSDMGTWSGMPEESKVRMNAVIERGLRNVLGKPQGGKAKVPEAKPVAPAATAPKETIKPVQTGTEKKAAVTREQVIEVLRKAHEKKASFKQTPVANSKEQDPMVQAPAKDAKPKVKKEDTSGVVQEDKKVKLPSSITVFDYSKLDAKEKKAAIQKMASLAQPMLKQAALQVRGEELLVSLKKRAAVERERERVYG